MQKRIQPLDVWATRQWRNKMFSNLNCNSRAYGKTALCLAPSPLRLRFMSCLLPQER
jgi:hypothetical protein